VRVVRIGLLGFAVVMLGLYAASFADFNCKPAPRTTLWLAHRRVALSLMGPQVPAAVPAPRLGFGGRLDRFLYQPVGQVWGDHRAFWLGSYSIMGDGTGTLIRGYVVNPARLALISGPAGLLLLGIPTRRKQQGACPACGYDKVGLAIDAVCPECGAGPAVMR